MRHQGSFSYEVPKIKKQIQQNNNARHDHNGRSSHEIAHRGASLLQYQN
jgi:hypothetical protein